MTMTELARRCEDAEGPSRELDAEIFIAVLWPDHKLQTTCDLFPDEVRTGRIQEPNGCGWMESPRYTSSLDAAMTLVPEGWLWQVELIGHQTKGRIGAAMAWLKHRQVEHGQAATPALALCAAALRAGGENG